MYNFHKDFQLNNNSFKNIDELLFYAKNLSSEIDDFLRNWFSSQPFIVIQTSGSTGAPKLIRIKKEFMVNSALSTGSYLNLSAKTSALLCLSTTYIAGKMMLVRALTLGWHLDVGTANSNPLENNFKRYDFSAMVPLQVEKTLNSLHRIKKIIVGGGVVSQVLQNKLQSISTEVYATYGMTETVSHIAIKKLNQISIKPNFYEVLPNIKIFIDARNCLVVNAKNVSEEIIFTNDVVQLISDTQFEWLGRFDNIINSGGIKLQPEKIEKILAKIIENRFFVAGIPDPQFGEKLILVVEGKKKKLHIKESKLLSKFETPKEIYFINNFIETETKKIQRKKTLDLIL